MTELIVIAEIAKGTIHTTTSELVTAANALGGSPMIIVPCTDASVADAAGSIAGASKVIAAKSDAFAHYDASAWAEALDAVAPQGTILTSATPQSKDLAARLAARRNLSVVQDVVAISQNQLTSPVYSGKAMQTVAISGPAVVSVRANVFDAAPSTGSNEISVVDTTGNMATAVQEFMARASQRLDVAEANIIISEIGRAHV